MRSDILALRGQVEHLVEDHRAQKAALSKKLSALEKSLERLDRHLDKSIGNLRTTSANSGSTIDEMRQIVQDLRGLEVKFKIERKQQQIDAIAPPNAEPLTSVAEPCLHMARNILKKAIAPNPSGHLLPLPTNSRPIQIPITRLLWWANV